MVQHAQTAEAGGILAVVLPQDLLPDLQRLDIKCFGPRIVALDPIQRPQTVEGVGIGRVVFAQGLLPDLQGLDVTAVPGPCVVVLGIVPVGQTVEALA